MSKYTNTSKTRAITFTLNDKGISTDIIISPEQSIELPDDNSHIVGLLDKKLISKDEVVVTAAKPVSQTSNTEK